MPGLKGVSITFEQRMFSSLHGLTNQVSIIPEEVNSGCFHQLHHLTYSTEKPTNDPELIHEACQNWDLSIPVSLGTTQKGFYLTKATYYCGPSPALAAQTIFDPSFNHSGLLLGGRSSHYSSPFRYLRSGARSRLRKGGLKDLERLLRRRPPIG